MHLLKTDFHSLTACGRVPRLAWQPLQFRGLADGAVVISRGPNSFRQTMYFIAVSAAMPKTRMRWTGSAMWRASSRMRSWRSLDGLRRRGRKMSFMTMVETGGSRSSATVCWLTSR